MYKKYLLLILFSNYIGVSIWSTNNIPFSKKDKIKDPIEQFQVPVTANINGSELGIHFQKTSDAFITIEGPEGVIYHRSTNVEETQSIYVDLTPYQEGEYTIYYRDTKGNELEGDFQKTESE